MLTMFADFKKKPHRNSDDEIDLLRRIKARDEEALSELYDLYSGLLFGMIMSIVKKREEAEKLLQEVFITVWNNANSFNENRGNVFFWIVTLARNHTINSIRNIRPATAQFSAAGATYDPMRTTIFSDRTELVKKALHEIPEEQSEVIKIASYRGLTQSEIADHLNTTVDTVKIRLRKGVKNLKRIMGDYISSDG